MIKDDFKVYKVTEDGNSLITDSSVKSIDDDDDNPISDGELLKTDSDICSEQLSSAREGRKIRVVW